MAQYSEEQLLQMSEEDMQTVRRMMETLPAEFQGLTIPKLRSQIHSYSHRSYAMYMEQTCLDANDIVFDFSKTYSGHLQFTLYRHQLRSLRCLTTGHDELRWLVTGSVSA